mgnify:CR=1 FL=1
MLGMDEKFKNCDVWKLQFGLRSEGEAGRKGEWKMPECLYSLDDDKRVPGTD